MKCTTFDLFGTLNEARRVRGRKRGRGGQRERGRESLWQNENVKRRDGKNASVVDLPMNRIGSCHFIFLLIF